MGKNPRKWRVGYRAEDHTVSSPSPFHPALQDKGTMEYMNGNHPVLAHYTRLGARYYVRLPAGQHSRLVRVFPAT